MKSFTTRQIILLGILLGLSGTLAHTTAQVAEAAEQHSFLTPLPVALVLMFSILLLSRIQSRFSGDDLFGALISRYPFFGRVVVTMYFLFNLIILTRDMRLLTDYVEITLLPMTPIMVIAFMLMITIVFMVRGGIVTLMGMAEIYVPFLMVPILVTQVGLGNSMDFSMLRPFLDFHFDGFMRGSWYIIAYMGDLVVLPYVLSGGNYKLRSGLGGVLGCTLLLISLLLQQQTMLGPALAAQMAFPSYEIARSLQITDFLDRFDLLVVGITLPTFTAKVGFDLYVLCSAARRLLPAVKGELTVLPLALLGFVCTFWFFDNLLQVFAFSREWTVFVLFFYVVLPVLLFFILHPKKEGGGQGKIQPGHVFGKSQLS